MVHYKVALSVWRKAGFEEAAFTTFCGLDIRTAPAGEEYLFLGEESINANPPVNCPKCKVLFDTVIDSFLADKNP